MCTVKKMFENVNTASNVMLSGPPGIGKSTVALAIGHHVFGPTKENLMGNVFEFNASGDRGIKFVNEQILPLTQHASLTIDSKWKKKIIIMDEADNMTSVALEALRGVMQESKYATIILIVNNINKISGPIHSRCFKFEFPRLDSICVAKRLKDVICSEKVEATDDGIMELAVTSVGDMRAAIKNTQIVAILHDNKITNDHVFNVLRILQPKHVKQLIDALCSDSLLVAIHLIVQFKDEMRVSGLDIIQTLGNIIPILEIPDMKFLCTVIDCLATCEVNMTLGSSELIELRVLCACIWRRLKSCPPQVKTYLRNIPIKNLRVPYETHVSTRKAHSSFSSSTSSTSSTSTSTSTRKLSTLPSTR
jgi:replication factor C subunit 2/4